MLNTHQILSSDDLTLLQANATEDSRAKIAGKIGPQLDYVDPASKEFEIACDIAFYLQKDDNKLVRISLADGLKECENAPKTLILLLASDEVDEVAVPVLRSSPVIADYDLVSLLNSMKSQQRLVAVAERRFLSVTVSSMLAEREIEPVSIALLSNESALINDDVVMQIAQHHARSNRVLQKMMKRMPMPTSAVSHMVRMQQASDQANNAPSEIKSFSSLEIEHLKNDILSLMFLGSNPDARTRHQMIEQFSQEGNMTAMVLLLTMCLGHKEFFIESMAHNTKLSALRVEELCSATQHEFAVLMNKSGISSSIYAIMFHVYQSMNKHLKNGLAVSSREYCKAMVGSLIEAEKTKVNFATTIGKPLAKAMKETFSL